MNSQRILREQETLSSIKNAKNRNHLIEGIRKKSIALEKENWYI